MTKAFIVGHPIKHSRSPLIHGFWLKQHGITGSYERIDVEPVNFGNFLNSFHGQGFAGGNVTIPHKEAAFAGVARKTGRAERLKAVNTIWIENGELWGDNTDVLGFMTNLDLTLGTGWEQDVDIALILGAGGAARGIVAGLQDRPIKRIFIVNRTIAKAEELVRDLARYGSVELKALSWEDLDQALGRSQLIVNTTSLGMAGQAPLHLDLAKAPGKAIVSDIVYVPLKTPLLAAAEAHGLRIVDGLGMLLHQAVPGFERWFGVKPEVTPELRALIVADLESAK
ncbi:shikimate dehydrogenase [Microvirga guangxiensis]|uniref:Shikimate dehydrogenase (NADP(+)) n=1 Tax=Microvirga guangxiensis TaxID=549386 RepID=A0A1G5FYJ5_9HYPH|nr:shikimate dehydrogenase [Microvirga guangxiensis]SCY44385.1 shikimate dehydrogenase [Microvirga guangxiensis]